MAASALDVCRLFLSLLHKQYSVTAIHAAFTLEQVLQVTWRWFKVCGRICTGYMQTLHRSYKDLSIRGYRFPQGSWNQPLRTQDDCNCNCTAGRGQICFSLSFSTFELSEVSVEKIHISSYQKEWDVRVLFFLTVLIFIFLAIKLNVSFMVFYLIT